MIPRDFFHASSAALLASLLIGGLGASAFAKEGGFQSMFDGKSLSGWVVIGNGQWKADGNLVVCEGGDGWLRSPREFKNFVIRLEWKLPPAGNSGLFLRAPVEGNPAYEGLEIQILDHFHADYKDIRDAQFTGSVYDLVAPKKEGLKPAGEWNAYEVTHDGQHIKVVLNGITITDADLNKVMDHADKHPGLKRREGYIGLQAHSTRVEFRKIEIRELP